MEWNLDFSFFAWQVPSDRILLETDSPEEGDPSLPEEGNSSQDLEPNASSGGSMKLPKETLDHPTNIHTVCFVVVTSLQL